MPTGEFTRLIDLLDSLDKDQRVGHGNHAIDVVFSKWLFGFMPNWEEEPSGSILGLYCAFRAGRGSIELDEVK